MKKFTFLLTALIVSVNTIFAADEVYKTALFGSKNNSKGVTNYTSTWTSTNDNFTVSLVKFNNNNNGWAGAIKTGAKNSTTTGTITTTATIDKAITKVVVTIDTIAYGSVTATTLEAATNKDFTTDLVTVSPAKYSEGGNWEYVLTSAAENKYYRLSFTCNNTSKNKNGVITLSKIEYYVAAPDVDATDIKLDQTTLSLEQYKYTTLTATLTPAEATTPIVWSSSDENIATVANGVVTAKAIGTAKIYATAGTVKDSCAVTVTAATPITVAKAVEIAKTVTKDNEIAAGGMYVIRGYVTEIFSEYDATYGNLSVWIDDEKGGSTDKFEAFRVIPITTDDQNVAVGDYVDVTADITKFTDSKTSTTIYETVGKTGTISIINKATYTITPLANDANMGNVKGYGVYTRGETATIYAVAYNGFEFVNWTDADNKEVSTNTDYSFTVTGDVTYTANFKALTFAVLTYVNDETMGSVEGDPDDYVAYGTEITLTAKPNIGYKFVNWTNADTEEEVSKEATYTFKVKEDIMLQANFVKDTSTAIDNASSTKAATKRIENGVLIIEKNGIRYNAQGVVVE